MTATMAVTVQGREPYLAGDYGDDVDRYYGIVAAHETKADVVKLTDKNGTETAIRDAVILEARIEGDAE